MFWTWQATSMVQEHENLLRQVFKNQFWAGSQETEWAAAMDLRPFQFALRSFDK